MVDQVGSRLHHAPCATTGAEAPALTAEGHQVPVAAAVTLDAQEAVFEQPAPQMVLELLADKSRQVTANTFDLPHELLPSHYRLYPESGCEGYWSGAKKGELNAPPLHLWAKVYGSIQAFFFHLQPASLHD